MSCIWLYPFVPVQGRDNSGAVLAWTQTPRGSPCRTVLSAELFYLTLGRGVGRATAVHCWGQDRNTVSADYTAFEDNVEPKWMRTCKRLLNSQWIALTLSVPSRDWLEPRGQLQRSQAVICTKHHIMTGRFLPWCHNDNQEKQQNIGYERFTKMSHFLVN